MDTEPIFTTLFENPLNNITLLGGFVFMIMGYIMYVFPPKKINSLYGYRTKRSMENQEKWDFAQIYSSKEMMKWGFVLACGFLLSFITHFDNTINMNIGLGLMFVTVFILFWRVEKAIKNQFEAS
ncbi:SdpI family protein [Flavobacterium agrisoli]|uniref:SdpI family protein n=1 Tax=Flavobacterium agrisoli TaxID=2793066 RepID=A0A934UJL8_9FLAO|nr:SdpI family protein [Flavobacterium agrisoli]MBK0369704.1 SdpI family protein [Flavobacterium agrisoli]